MSRPTQSPTARPARRLASRSTQIVSIDIGALRRLNQAWLLIGSFAVVLVPGLRGFDATIGYWPFWLIAAPLLNLLALHPHRLAALSQRFLVGLRQRRQAVSRRTQAKPRRRRVPGRGRGEQMSERTSRRSVHALLAALLSVNLRH